MKLRLLLNDECFKLRNCLIKELYDCSTGMSKTMKMTLAFSLVSNWSIALICWLDWLVIFWCFLHSHNGYLKTYCFVSKHELKVTSLASYSLNMEYCESIQMSLSRKIPVLAACGKNIAKFRISAENYP